ncbi:MAG TPA: histone deacetylase [Bacteroidetes bacterium]|nr:histone deacetylase [Bacteroidota bacterium]
MKIIYNDIFLQHNTGNHPENKNRLLAFGDISQSTIIDGTPYLSLVHNGQYISDVQQKCNLDIPLDPDTQCSVQSFETAVNAVGATVMAAENGDFALVRPPGHHAYPGKGTGFCIFNNIAIAAMKLASEGKKVAIIDIDGHFGDGTSKVFYEMDNVMYMSLHQFPAFPGDGYWTDIGSGRGEGYNINIPLPPYSGDDIFLDAFNTFLPVIRQFKPDVVAVSAGFDTHKSDMLLQLNVSLDSYYKIGKILKENFENIFAVLEGGYNPDILVKSVYNFIAGINGEKIVYSERHSESDVKIFQTYDNYCNNLIVKLREYWKF